MSSQSIIPGAPLIGSGAQPPLVLTQCVAQNDVRPPVTCSQECGRQPWAIEDQHYEHGRQRDSVLRQAAQALKQSDWAIAGVAEPGAGDRKSPAIRKKRGQLLRILVDQSW